MLLKLFTILSTGFLLGVQHSLDADHIAAVSTIVSKNKSLKKSALVGAYWGIGHTVTLLVIGVLVLALKIKIPGSVSRMFEFAVGAMLLYLGAGLLKSVLVDRIHIHRHKHDQVEHVHLHSHKWGAEHEHVHKPLLVGMLHGLAGSAGIMILIMASLDSIAQGVMFTLIFGLGSILGMVVSGAVIGLPFLLIANNAKVTQIFMLLVAFVSMGIGANILHENWIF